MQRLHVGEVGFGRLAQRDVGVRAADAHVDAATFEGGQRVLQAHAELADHKVRFAPLLQALVLGQVLVAESPPEVRDVPAVAALDDLWLGRAAERLLVEGVGDDLAHSLGDAPMVEDLLDVEVKQ